MDAIAAIMARRSIRKYTSEAVTEDAMKTLLKAGFAAPSSNNRQPWHFVVIDDREMLDSVPDFHPYSKMLLEAPAAVLVCGDERITKRPRGSIVDCAAAVQNILVAAQALGLATCWLAIDPVEERIAGIRKLCGVPEEVVPLALIALGHGAEEKPPNDRYLADRVHRNRWVE